MVVKVKINGQTERALVKEKPIVAPIRGVPKRRENLIIRALRIMIVDVRMVLHRKETEEQMETYRQFSQLATRRK